jgi:hypothetical protein
MMVTADGVPVGRYASYDPRSPNGTTVRRYAFGHLPWSEPWRQVPRAEARCRRCVSQVGKSPSGHLFESLTCGYIVFEIGPPDLNPHTA